MFVCVCVCMCVCMCVCVCVSNMCAYARVCVCARVWVCARMFVRARWQADLLSMLTEILNNTNGENIEVVPFTV